MISIAVWRAGKLIGAHKVNDFIDLPGKLYDVRRTLGLIQVGIKRLGENTIEIEYIDLDTVEIQIICDYNGLPKAPADRMLELAE